MSFTIANKRNETDLLAVQNVLSFIGLCMMLVYFQYIRYLMRKIEVECDEEIVSPSDYSLMMVGFPKD